MTKSAKRMVCYLALLLISACDKPDDKMQSPIMAASATAAPTAPMATMAPMADHRDGGMNAMAGGQGPGMAGMAPTAGGPAGGMHDGMKPTPASSATGHM